MAPLQPDTTVEPTHRRRVPPSECRGEATSWLTAAEMATLEAVCDTIVPAVAPPPGEQDAHGLYARAASNLRVAASMAELLAGTSSESWAEFKQLLGLLLSPLAGLLLAGKPRAFTGLSPREREAALVAMSTSTVPQLRQGFQALKRLSTFVFYSAHAGGDGNPNWPALGYSPVRPRETAPKTIRTAVVDTFIILARDTGEGRVTLDRQGDPVLCYWPNARDRFRLTLGMREVTRIALAGGAICVATLHTPRLRLDSEGSKPGAVTAVRLDGFLAEIKRRGIQRNRVPLFSAHQMGSPKGSPRLGGDPRTSVARPDGEVHGIRGLFIADASGFPTACGVNPMISTMGLAYHVAQQLKARA